MSGTIDTTNVGAIAKQYGIKFNREDGDLIAVIPHATPIRVRIRRNENVQRGYWGAYKTSTWDLFGHDQAEIKVKVVTHAIRSYNLQPVGV